MSVFFLFFCHSKLGHSLYQTQQERDRRASIRTLQEATALDRCENEERGKQQGGRYGRRNKDSNGP